MFFIPSFSTSVAAQGRDWQNTGTQETEVVQKVEIFIYMLVQVRKCRGAGWVDEGHCLPSVRCCGQA